MVDTKWLNTKTQPLAIRDVLSFLHKALGKKELYNTSYDIFGPEILTYKTMLLQFAEVRKLNRWILTVPVMTPKLSSYWLYFVTSTSYKLASSLVNLRPTSPTAPFLCFAIIIFANPSVEFPSSSSVIP